MSQVISGVDDADLYGVAVGRRGDLLSLNHGNSIGSLLREATTILRGRRSVLVMRMMTGPATDEGEGMDLGIELDALDVGVVLDGDPLATLYFQGGNLALGGKVLDLAVLGDLLEVLLALKTDV